MRPWPKIAEEDQWLIELMEEQFEKTSLTPEQLRARAYVLYAQAAGDRVNGRHDALLALADRYELTATARAPARGDQTG